MAVLAGPLVAQQMASTVGRCNAGPGAAFGITAYQCANCGFRSETGKRQEYTFFAEPVVTGVARGATLENGDVIEAVDGNPIVTQAGSDAFAYPGAGKHTLTVRRGRDRREIQFTFGSACIMSWTDFRGDTLVHVGTGAGWGSGSSSGGRSSSSSRGATGTGRGVGIPTIGGEPIFVVDGVEQKRSGPPATGKFGFAVECNPSCTRMRTAGGLNYYKYDGFPRIIEVRDRSAADRAGLRVGDLIVKVDGRPILDDDAGLAATEDRDQLRITVRRDGKDIDVLLLLTKG